MNYRLLYIIVWALLVGSLAWSCCNNAKRIKKVELIADSTEVAECTCPHCRLLIQPYGDFSQARAQEVSNQLVAALDKHMNGLAVTEVKILPAKPLSVGLMNDGKTRYRASKILDQQQGQLQQPGDVIIGLTDKDISTTLHGHDDFGILGLSYMNKSNCVISTFRVKDKSQFWKVVLHEFGHGFLGLPHCPNKDRSCFMVDANGKPNLSPERHFCDSCAKYIPKQHF